MPCKQWNETWVAHLYDELEEAEARELRQHLDSCEPCRRHMDELAASRVALHDACPVVPATPNVIVLRPRRFLQPLWAYATGAMFAMLVFAGGLLAGYHLLGTEPATGSTIADASPSAAEETEEALLARMDSMQQRIDQLEQLGQSGDSEPASATVQAGFLTQGELDEEIRQFERRNDVQRARDFQFLLDEITASELRTGAHINHTREALQVVAVKSDPRFMER